MVWIVFLSSQIENLCKRALVFLSLNLNVSEIERA